jgi:hypothetical protein
VEAKNQPQTQLFDWISELQAKVEQAEMYLRQLDRCEFCTENGWRCSEKKVRIVQGVFCCEEHAKERARYFGET